MISKTIIRVGTVKTVTPFERPRMRAFSEIFGILDIPSGGGMYLYPSLDSPKELGAVIAKLTRKGNQSTQHAEGKRSVAVAFFLYTIKVRSST